MPLSDDFAAVVVVADGEAVVRLVGQIDLGAKDRLIEALTEAAADRQRLVIDLSATSFMDSTGLKALSDAWRAQADAGLELVVRDPSPPVLRTMEIAGLADVLPIERTDRPDRP